MGGELSTDDYTKISMNERCKTTQRTMIRENSKSRASSDSAHVAEDGGWKDDPVGGNGGRVPERMPRLKRKKLELCREQIDGHSDGGWRR